MENRSVNIQIMEVSEEEEKYRAEYLNNMTGFHRLEKVLKPQKYKYKHLKKQDR